MHPRTTSAFALPQRLSAKTAPALIARDEQHFAAMAHAIDQQVSELVEQLEILRKAPGGKGRGAMDRDLEIHRLTARLRVLRRYHLDMCLGRMVGTDDEPVYVGRLALTDDAGDPLLLDWRAPAAEPFFAATAAHPMGLLSRRRYRWAGDLVVDYWDEAFTTEGLVSQASLDDDSAFIASLGSSRSSQMRDVLSTIAAEQDAIIRASSRGALVVDGGPGTGKTVVALHRTAYLLYADPRLGHHHGGVLFVGPHAPYLAYVADVLPSLGEEGVQTVTLRDLVVEGAAAGPEADPRVARLKASLELVAAIEPAVTFYEEPPTEGMTVETEWADVWLSATEWAEAFEAPDPGTPHNEARDQVWEELLDLLVAKVDDDVPPELLRRSLAQNDELAGTFRRAWPILDPAELVGDLWTVPAYLRRCAPGLSAEAVRTLQRAVPDAWTTSDLPLLDAARQRIGDPNASLRQRRREAATVEERQRMDDVVDYLLQNDDDPESSLNLLRRESLREDLVDEAALPGVDPDLLAGPFSHIVVDEAQELTDAEWQMLVRRCPSRSVTIAGDRAQARHGFEKSWEERLGSLGFDRVAVATLSINYRTPVEVMAEAEPVIRALLPDANVPTSIRTSGVPVRYGSVAELDVVVDDWLSTHPEGVACVIGSPTFRGRSRGQSLDPERCKGLEFDLVVLVSPERWGEGIEGTVDRYVAMTRATQQLVILD